MKPTTPNDASKALEPEAEGFRGGLRWPVFHHPAEVWTDHASDGKSPVSRAKRRWLTLSPPWKSWVLAAMVGAVILSGSSGCEPQRDVEALKRAAAEAAEQAEKARQQAAEEVRRRTASEESAQRFAITAMVALVLIAVIGGLIWGVSIGLKTRVDQARQRTDKADAGGSNDANTDIV